MYKYAQIIIQFATIPEIDRFFTYKIEGDLLQKVRIGHRVKVPFGPHNALQIGYVIQIKDEVEQGGYAIKKISTVVDEEPIISPMQWDIINFMVDHYGISFAAAIDATLPPGLTQKPFDIKAEEEEYVALVEDIKKVQLYKLQNQHKKTFAKQQWIIDYLSLHKKVLMSHLKKMPEASSSSIKTLLQNNILCAFKEQKADKRDGISYEKFKVLNEEQREATNVIVEALQSEEYQTILLKGITGSGKTEVFLYTIKEVIEKGGSVIVLVPEIALTKQTVDRFKERFGNHVALTHSRMTPKERQKLYAKVQRGEVSIVIGPRSAVFMPFDHLKMIVIDEEHEASYKSESNPKYHAIDVAKRRMQKEKGIVLLSTATPSLETYYQVKEHHYNQVCLSQRVGDAVLPEVEIVDMRLELRQGNNNLMSHRLYSAIEETLKEDKQVMVLINRRGHSTFINCRNCGHVIKCNHCDVSMTYHRATHSLECHYCGHQEKTPEKCPECQSSHIKFFGGGTEKIEEYVENHFSTYGIGRMDLDTTAGKEGHHSILEDFRRRKTNLLIGTQMIAKGHDFPEVGLVGVISADMSLYMQDFRSNEKTFQLLTQATGRAGRSASKGRVIIQTYNPEHIVIEMLKNNQQEIFYQEELMNRQLLGYPPYGHIFSLLITGKNEDEVIRGAHVLSEYYKHYSRRAKNNFRIIGPSTAVIGKLIDEYRWRIIIISDNRDKLLIYGKYCLEKFYKQSSCKSIKIQWDIDPINMM